MPIQNLLALPLTLDDWASCRPPPPDGHRPGWRELAQAYLLHAFDHAAVLAPAWAAATLGEKRELLEAELGEYMSVPIVWLRS